MKDVLHIFCPPKTTIENNMSEKEPTTTVVVAKTRTLLVAWGSKEKHPFVGNSKI